MKSATYLKKWKETKELTLRELDNFNKRLWREGKLPITQEIRYKVLVNWFDIVNAGYQNNLGEIPEKFEDIGTFDDLYKKFAK